MNSEIFVKKSNLPHGRVTELIASGRYGFIISELKRLGIAVTEADELVGVSGAERFHADISAVHLGGENILAARNNTALIDKLRRSGCAVLLSEGEISGKYPSCTALNALLLDKRMIVRTSSADKALKKHCENEAYKIINVRQGYARCSAAVVSENALITEDEGIYRACLENNIDALKIESGGVSIEDYDCGFIGGACGKLSGDILAFCGDIRRHKNYSDIKAFALNYGVNLLSLLGGELFDIGGFIQIKERSF